tara:strand:+ start:946 stop:1104 length:159 start_codon:yes stop_codon:yes gene_type:complete
MQQLIQIPLKGFMEIYINNGKITSCVIKFPDGSEWKDVPVAIDEIYAKEIKE